MPGDVVRAYCHQGNVEHCFMESCDDSTFFDIVSGQHRLNHQRVLRMFTRTNGLVEGRNKVVAAFLDETDGEWLWWADTDMGWRHDAIHALLATADPRDRPIVGALCFAYKNGPNPTPEHGQLHVAMPTIYQWISEPFTGMTPYIDYPVGAVIRCDATGSAFIVIHRSVLERMRDAYGDNWYTQITPDGSRAPFGEDVSFCWRAKELGIPIHVDAAVRTTHHKTEYVDESLFMAQLKPPPATDPTAVLVPVVGRPANAEPFMRSLRASTGLATVYAICENDDVETQAAWETAGAQVLASDRKSFAEKVNTGYRFTVEPWLFLVGDDVRFQSGWLDHAQGVALSHGAKVVGTNDLGNPRVTSGEHATHMLISREYVDTVGASWDGPGVVCHEGYRHWFVDDEIVTAAKQRGVWGMALGSIVEHMHPLFGKGADDETYRKGQRHQGKDKALFVRRLRENTQAVAA